MEIILKEVKPGDMGWVIAKHGEIYFDEFQFDSNFEVDIANKMIALWDKSDAFYKLWIAEINGERAGSIAVSKKSDEVAFVNFLLVLREFRGKGVAKALMNKAIAQSVAHKYKILRLETYSCLKNARKFYKKTGFCLSGPARTMKKYSQSFDQEFWELKL